jgi:hypothetical protein
MQDWPVNTGTNYVGNIPRFVELGELRLVRDLNLEFWDTTDTSFELLSGTNIIQKPAELIVLRTMRLALITATTNHAAVPAALCAAQATNVNQTALVFNGSLGLAPVTINPPAQVLVTEVADSLGGIQVIVTGLDLNGVLTGETITTLPGVPVSGTIQYSQIQTLTAGNGSTPQTIEVGTAAVAVTTLGQSFPVYKRSPDFVANYGSSPSATARPKYYCEIAEEQWQVAQAADQNYQAVVRFLKRPASVVITGTSWLADRCGDLLLDCALMEAENYLKADDRFADIQGDYQTKLAIARAELRNAIRQGDYSPVKAAASTQG